LLFSKIDSHSIIQAQQNAVATEIDKFDANRILNSSIEDLCAYIEAKYQLETPTIMRDEAVVDQHEGQIEIRDSYRRNDRYAPTMVVGTVVELTVPFTGDAQMFRVRPSTYNLSPPSGAIQRTNLLLRVEGVQLSPEAVKRELDKQLDDVDQWLARLRSDERQFNDSLRQRARQHIERRREKLLADRNLVANLGFPMRKRPDATMTYTAPNVQRKIQPTLPPASTTAYKPEPALSEGEYRNILDIIASMALVMERSPKAFKTMGEEDLRPHFLVQLNGQYEGQATGETFNFQGKTDILIREQDRNIFIAECKFWRGEKALAETIAQILSYLSWRDTKAAIIVFNRNKDFSDVLTKMQAAIRAHPNWKNGPKLEGETRFRYVFGQKTDPTREVALTVLAFDVPKAE
jgi:hypothetical protein